MSGSLYPQESIYNLLPKEEVHVEKPPRYTSKFRPTVVLEKQLTRDAMKTMGPAKVEAPSPQKYLKKQSKEPKQPKCYQCPNNIHKPCASKKPAVPLRSDHPPMGVYTKRDPAKTAKAVAIKPEPTSVDTHRGHRETLENSGRLPKYILKKDYGEIPQYLQQRKEEEQRAQEEYDEYVREQREQGAMTHLSDEERDAMLESLKKTWDELHHEYQSLPLVTDSLSRKCHKQRLEGALKQLEKDISLVEKFKSIYIANN